MRLFKYTIIIVLALLPWLLGGQMLVTLIIIALFLLVMFVGFTSSRISHGKNEKRVVQFRRLFSKRIAEDHYGQGDLVAGSKITEEKSTKTPSPSNQSTGGTDTGYPSSDPANDKAHEAIDGNEPEMAESNELSEHLPDSDIAAEPEGDDNLGVYVPINPSPKVAVSKRRGFYNFGKSKVFGAGELYGPNAAKGLSTGNSNRPFYSQSGPLRHKKMIDYRELDEAEEEAVFVQDPIFIPVEAIPVESLSPDDEYFSERYSEILTHLDAVDSAQKTPTTNTPDETLKDHVKCSVFAPEEVLRDESFLLMVFAHVPEETKEVEKTAKVFDESMVKKAIKSLDKEIARGSRITFQLTIRGAEIEEDEQIILWQGVSTSVEFIVSVPASYIKGSIFGKLAIRQDNVPVGHITFQLKITDQEETLDSENFAETKPKNYEYAFISYASEDRQEVLKRTQMLNRVGLRYFQDLLSLEPGELWERALETEIDKSDVFFLFWSKAAKESEWVRREWMYALIENDGKVGKTPVIEPVILEGPPIIPPPLPLSHLHFNDTHLYFLKEPS